MTFSCDNPSNRSTCLGLCVAVLVSLGHLAPVSAEAPARADTLRQVAGILDYIGGDYRGAVAADGSMESPSEYAEQRALAGDADALAGQAGLAPGDPLRLQLKAVSSALEARKPPAEVEALCREARQRIVRLHGVDLTPSSVPSLSRAKALYASQGCASCHGVDGSAQTPAALALDPRPANFLDPERVATLSAHRAFHALSFGVSGTAMRAYAELGDADRWSLAFFVLSLRHQAADAVSGRRAFETAHKPAPEDARALSALTEEELEARLAVIGDAGARRNALAYLRTQAPFNAGETGFSRAYAQLDAGLTAYLHGDREQARRAFISAYLDGVEPHEAALRARDKNLVSEIENAMLALRSASANGAEPAQLRAAVERTRLLLDRASASESSADTAFIGALTIALREGLEIMLLLTALLGLVRKRGRPELARYVHAGWLASVPAGFATFLGAQAVLSGMQRELAEGIASILAAFVLLGVTHWLLGQVGAKHWAGFLARRIGAATSGPGAGLGVFLLAFLAAYREAFEIVLFYQALALDAGAAVREVWLGAGAGLVILCIAALLLLRIGRKLKPAPFMLASSLCLAVLSLVLVGKGVRALQEAGVLSLTHLSFPELPDLGFYATVEGLLAQGVLLGFLALSAILPRLRARRTPARDAAPAE